MISLATCILWAHILAVAIWLGGALTSLVAIHPGEGDARVSAARRAQFLARWAPWPPCWGSAYGPFSPADVGRVAPRLVAGSLVLGAFDGQDLITAV